MFGTRVEPWRPTALTARRMSRPNSEGPLGECTSTVATCAIGPRICPRRQGLLLTYHPNPAAMPGYRHGHGRTGKPIHPPTTPRPPFAARARMAASRPFVLAVLRGSVLSPVRTRRCLRRGREPARRLADNVLIEPRIAASRLAVRPVEAQALRRRRRVLRILVISSMSTGSILSLGHVRSRLVDVGGMRSDAGQMAEGRSPRRRPVSWCSRSRTPLRRPGPR